MVQYLCTFTTLSPVHHNVSKAGDFFWCPYHDDCYRRSAIKDLRRYPVGVKWSRYFGKRSFRSSYTSLSGPPLFCTASRPIDRPMSPLSIPVLLYSCRSAATSRSAQPFAHSLYLASYYYGARTRSNYTISSL